MKRIVIGIAFSAVLAFTLITGGTAAYADGSPLSPTSGPVQTPPAGVTWE